MNYRRLFLLPLFTLSLSAQAAETSPAVVLSETKEQHDARMQWWRESKFGMFITWGLHAQAAGEWNGQVPAKDRDQRAEGLMEAVRMTGSRCPGPVVVGTVTLTQAGALPVTLMTSGNQTSRLNVQSVMLIPQP